MNLKPFVNKSVVVQLKPGLAWIACQADDRGDVEPMMQRDSSGKETGLVSSLYLQGKLLERDGEYVVKYRANKANMETTVFPEAIFAVTCVSEDKILVP